MDKNFSTEEVFNSAVSVVRSLPKDGPIKPSNEVRLKFYAYFKQATHGPNDTPKPRFYQIAEAYKWDAWKQLGDMSKEDAMLSYIQELKQAMGLVTGVDDDSDTVKNFQDVLGEKFFEYCRSSDNSRFPGLSN